MTNKMPETIWAYGDPLNGWYEDDQCTEGGSKYTQTAALIEKLEGMKTTYNPAFDSLINGMAIQSDVDKIDEQNKIHNTCLETIIKELRNE